MNWTFLVIDDRTDDLAAASAQLVRACPAAAVLTAANGPAAFELLEERRLVPSLTFVAFDLPGMGGLEFLSALHRHRWLDRAPVAVLSERLADRHVITCYRMGASVVLEKPLHQFELRQAIREFARAARPLAAANLVTPAGFRRTAA